MVRMYAVTTAHAPFAHPDPARRQRIHAIPALVAVGLIGGAVERRCTEDLLDAWRRFVDAIGRYDLLNLPTLVDARPIRLRTGADWLYVQGLVLAAIRNLDATDGERHLRLCGQAFVQLERNHLLALGLELAHHLDRCNAAGWVDDDDNPLPEALDDQVAAVAVLTARHARRALGEARRVETVCGAHYRGLNAVDAELASALREVGLLTRARDPFSTDPEDTVTVCTPCDTAEGHTADCPLVDLNATRLLGIYWTAAEGGN